MRTALVLALILALSPAYAVSPTKREIHAKTWTVILCRISARKFCD